MGASWRRTSCKGVVRNENGRKRKFIKKKKECLTQTYFNPITINLDLRAFM